MQCYGKLCIVCYSQGDVAVTLVNVACIPGLGFNYFRFMPHRQNIGMLLFRRC